MWVHSLPRGALRRGPRWCSAERCAAVFLLSWRNGQTSMLPDFYRKFFLLSDGSKERDSHRTATCLLAKPQTVHCADTDLKHGCSADGRFGFSAQKVLSLLAVEGWGSVIRVVVSMLEGQIFICFLYASVCSF